MLRCRVGLELPILCPRRPADAVATLLQCSTAEAKQLTRDVQSGARFLLSDNDVLVSGKDQTITLGEVLSQTVELPEWAKVGKGVEKSSGGSGSANGGEKEGSKGKGGKGGKGGKKGKGGKGGGKKGKKGKGKGKGGGKGKKGGSSNQSLLMYEESDDDDDEKKKQDQERQNGRGQNGGATAAVLTMLGETVSVEMMMVRGGAAAASATCGAGDYVVHTRCFSCDVVCVAHSTTTLAEIHANLTRGVTRQVMMLSNAMESYLKSEHDHNNMLLLPRYEVLLFTPSSSLEIPVGAAFVTVDGEQESVTLSREQETRMLLHGAMRMPLVPTFRRCSSWGGRTSGGTSGGISGGTSGGKKIVNVHEHCPLPPETRSSDGYTLHMVDRGYRYYHYMQDKYDDKGWGCAYRSLQTLWSWFELHQYTELMPPNHERIQQILARVDPTKGPMFVGSKEWIGSQGVGYVLDDQLDITSKFLFVPSGAELKSKARTLAQHFDTHGTPVMMGGGALAFTILGVAWHRGTGDMSMLILDPHYTGSDDVMDNIVTKEAKLEGYKARPCGWRRPESFESQAFYNLCCPQRPSGVV